MKELTDYKFDELVKEQALEVHSELLARGGEGLRHAVYNAMRVAIDWRVAKDEKTREDERKRELEAKKGKGNA